MMNKLLTFEKKEYLCKHIDNYKSSMTIEDVKAIIQGDETRTLEVKKTTGELKDGMRSPHVLSLTQLVAGCSLVLLLLH